MNDLEARIAALEAELKRLKEERDRPATLFAPVRILGDQGQTLAVIGSAGPRGGAALQLFDEGGVGISLRCGLGSGHVAIVGPNGELAQLRGDEADGGRVVLCDAEGAAIAWAGIDGDTGQPGFKSAALAPVTAPEDRPARDEIDDTARRLLGDEPA